MRIKRLDVCGFKSFPDKTTLIFDKPIVGVVGPNGCGKSNIVDATRWVLGEQSIKSLRGRNREDVIFAGTETRAPMGMAEVTLTFDNSDGRAPIEYADYSEISVTRKLYRNGDSEYLVNNGPCRLRDITDLFLGTGAGNKAYSIIEQGHISLIVSAKADERRSMIEEAAGITKYYSRKREAERKMEHTRQNLLRVTDVISELKKQLNALSRQAKKAERYKEFKQRIKSLELAFASLEYHELLNKINLTVDALEKLQDEKQAQELKYVAVEGEVNAKNLTLADREQTLSDRQEKLFRLDQAIQLDERNIEVFVDERKRIDEQEGNIDREFDSLERNLKESAEKLEALEAEQAGALEFVQGKEADLAESAAEHRHAMDAFNKQQLDVERLKRAIYEAMNEVDRVDSKLEMLKHRMADNEARMARNRQEYDALAERHNDLKNERQRFADELGGLKQLQLKLDTQRTEQSAKLEREREIYLDVEERLVAERDRLTAMRSRLDSLAELDKSLEGFSEGAKAALEDDSGRFDSGDLVDALARLVDVDPAHEAAVASVLGDRLQWLLVADESSGHKGLALLREKKAGKAGFVPLEGPEPEVSAELPANAVSVLEFIKPQPEAASVFKRLLYDTYFVETLDEAIAGWKQSGGRCVFVSQNGDYVDRSGAICGGSGESLSQTLLKRRRDMQQLTEGVQTQEELAEQLTMQRDERIAAIRELEQQIESTRREEHKQEIKILEQEKDLHHLANELDQTKRRMDALERELATFTKQRTDLDAERDTLNAQRAQVLEKRQQAESNLTAAQETLEGLAEKRDVTMQIVTQKQVAVAEARQRREHLDSELSSARARVNDLTQRRDRLQFEHKRGRERIEELKKLSEHTEIQLRQRVTDREKQRQSLADDRDEFNREQATVREQIEELKKLRTDLDAAGKKLNELSMQRQEMTMDARYREERMHERYGVDLAAEYMTYLPEQGEEPDEDARKEIAGLRDKIDRMGEVNLTAISEYDRVSERYQFLMDQQDDLTQSLEMLENAIKKINRTTRKRFRETFDAVNQKFSELFPQLFGGGEAYLEFTDPNDLLNTGVEIIARPPGKRLQSVNLLSGGEKAMTAMSLIFAIFLYRPTPFCLLDEVDAPLDDINITRFNNALKQISKVSQFIIITHNKKTMEITNTLYGVTMEEAGISKIVSVNLT